VARPRLEGEKRIGRRASQHEECEALGSLLLPCAVTRVSLLAVWCLRGATPRGQPWTPAVMLPHRRNGLSVRRMAVLSTFREPSLCRQVHREFMRNAVLDVTPIIPATACHQRNYIERYSRCRVTRLVPTQLECGTCGCTMKHHYLIETLQKCQWTYENVWSYRPHVAWQCDDRTSRDQITPADRQGIGRAGLRRLSLA
jgi:hypothetical protein